MAEPDNPSTNELAMHTQFERNDSLFEKLSSVLKWPCFFIALPKKHEPKTGVPVRLLETIKFDNRHKYLIMHHYGLKTLSKNTIDAKLIRLIGSVLAVIAIIRLWGLSQYKILWWAILVLFILDWVTGETVKTASKDGSKGDVIKFWVRPNMFISPSCLILSVIGILLTFF